MASNRLNLDRNEGPIDPVNVACKTETPDDLRIAQKLTAIQWLLQKHGHEIGLGFSQAQSDDKGSRLIVEFDRADDCFGIRLTAEID